MKISVFLVITLAGTSLAQDEKPKSAPDKGPPKRESRGFGSDPLRDLSSEERTKLREAMRDVWTDPSVLQSREDVDQSVKAFKSAIQKALLKKDPTLQPIITKMEKQTRNSMKSMLDGKSGKGGGKGSHHFSGSEMRGFERMSESPSFLEKLSKPEKEKYFKIRDEVKGSPEIQAIMKKFEGFRDQDDRVRRERTKVFGELRKTFHEKMIEADPEMESLLKHAGPPPKRPESGTRSPGQKKEQPKKE